MAGWPQRKRKASINTETEPREKGIPLSASFKNSINNNSKCNNAHTPGTRVSRECDFVQGLAGQRCDLSLHLSLDLTKGKTNRQTAFLYI